MAALKTNLDPPYLHGFQLDNICLMIRQFVFNFDAHSEQSLFAMTFQMPLLNNVPVAPPSLAFEGNRDGGIKNPSTSFIKIVHAGTSPQEWARRRTPTPQPEPRARHQASKVLLHPLPSPTPPLLLCVSIPSPRPMVEFHERNYLFNDFVVCELEENSPKLVEFHKRKNICFGFVVDEWKKNIGFGCNDIVGNAICSLVDSLKVSSKNEVEFNIEVGFFNYCHNATLNPPPPFAFPPWMLARLHAPGCLKGGVGHCVHNTPLLSVASPPCKLSSDPSSVSFLPFFGPWNQYPPHPQGNRQINASKKHDFSKMPKKRAYFCDNFKFRRAPDFVAHMHLFFINPNLLDTLLGPGRKFLRAPFSDRSIWAHLGARMVQKTPPSGYNAHPLELGKNAQNSTPSLHMVDLVQKCSKNTSFSQNSAIPPSVTHFSSIFPKGHDFPATFCKFPSFYDGWVQGTPPSPTPGISALPGMVGTPPLHE